MRYLQGDETQHAPNWHPPGMLSHDAYYMPFLSISVMDFGVGERGHGFFTNEQKRPLILTIPILSNFLHFLHSLLLIFQAIHPKRDVVRFRVFMIQVAGSTGCDELWIGEETGISNEHEIDVAV